MSGKAPNFRSVMGITAAVIAAVLIMPAAASAAAEDYYAQLSEQDLVPAIIDALPEGENVLIGTTEQSFQSAGPADLQRVNAALKGKRFPHPLIVEPQRSTGPAVTVLQALRQSLLAWTTGGRALVTANYLPEELPIAELLIARSANPSDTKRATHWGATAIASYQGTVFVLLQAGAPRRKVVFRYVHRDGGWRETAGTTDLAASNLISWAMSNGRITLALVRSKGSLN